ncbi:hypothetical protein IOD16_13335 [Saccharothrix sp. 6-C]|uniref:hypothetical protein n=1 Tax=Saccharothrix sp. 6-C TaxID=2781735 RepID=UPI001916D177|nr:hypothetical protein [Saccharothrix sp. 6-C]QQQ79314.1 hypothetical protein IOD16_13335 [Saccharothrix sp. 6-C]
MGDGRFTRGHVVTLMITSLIGVGFGAGWWFSGVAAVSAGGTALAVVGAVIALALTGWVFRFGRAGRGSPPGGGRSDSPFGKGYGIAVLLMLVAIFGGARLLASLDLARATPAWVLFVVGAHFAPFAKLFGSNRYLLLAALLCGTAVFAVVLGAVGPEWAWRLVPGFGGAAVLWGTVVAGLRDGWRQVARDAVRAG